MNSKEALNSIANKCAIKEYDKDGNLIKWVGTIDKEYLTIMKDLEQEELLETELKLERDKVKYVMGQLKKQDKILEILKNKKSRYCLFINVLI